MEGEIGYRSQDEFQDCEDVRLSSAGPYQSISLDDVVSCNILNLGARTASQITSNAVSMTTTSEPTYVIAR